MRKRDQAHRGTFRPGMRRRSELIAATLAVTLVAPVAASSLAYATDDAPADAPAGATVEADGLVVLGNGQQNLDLVLAHADDHVGQVGDLVLVGDPAPIGPVAAAMAIDDGLETPQEAVPTVDEAFTLHSRPNASRKILIDFDGQYVDSQNWNGGTPIDAAAYSSGDDQSDENFSATDLIAIKNIWASVSEDYAAWDVDVTTEDPGAQGLAKNGENDDEYGIRVIVTPTYEWYSTNRFGGVAFLHTFDRHEDLPAWVFSGNLSNGNPKSVAEAISHEAGHTFGLSHDGVTTTGTNGNSTTSGYYSGHGDWAPIMGVGYYKPVTQWSKGEYPGATNEQDDLAIIDGYLPRLESNTAVSAFAPSAAPAVLGPGSSTSVHVLTHGGDVDEHTIEIESGPVTVSVEKHNPEGNLLAELHVLDSTGTTIASAAPGDASSWSLEVTLPVGTDPGLYTLEIESIGWNPFDDPGFTDYASIGDYVLSIDAPDPSTNSGPADEPPTPTEAGDRLTAITPQRVLDTRRADSAVVGPLQAARDTTIELDGVPADATAAVLNVTAVAPSGAGFFSLTPCGTTDDARTSSLNFAAGRNVANSVIVPLSTAGDVCLYSSVPAHALLDVTGWIGASGQSSLDELTSARIVDTRTDSGISGRLAAGVRTPVSLDALLDNESISAVALNVTAIRPSAAGFLTVDDCSSGQLATSSLNFVGGEIRGNNGVFALDAEQQLCITSSTSTHVTIDVTGEFGPDAGLTFVPSSTPERILDTRQTGRVDAGDTTSFDVVTSAGENTLVRSPVAASVNLTATRDDAGGFVTAWACGTRPETSALNPSAGTATANGALVELTAAGASCLFHNTDGELIVDLAGWWI